MSELEIYKKAFELACRYITDAEAIINDGYSRDWGIVKNVLLAKAKIEIKSEAKK